MKGLKALPIMLALYAAPVFCAHVVKVSADGKQVAVTHSLDRRWQEEEKLCVYSGSTESCGVVVATTERGAVLELEEATKEIARGDRVRFASTGDFEWKVENEFEMQAERQSMPLLLSGGINFIYPIVNFNIALTQHYAIGAMGSYYRYRLVGVDAINYGVLVVVHYYSEQPFEGFWAQAGVGVYTSNLKYNGGIGYSRSDTAIATLGWRWSIKEWLNFGVGAGTQWIRTRAKSGFTDFEVSSWLPTVVMDFGFTF